MRPFWIWRSHANSTHQIGLQSITPITQMIGLRWPGGGWLWQYPLAVEVYDEGEGMQKRLPIPDPTRTVVWLLYALALVVLVVTAFTLWRSRQHTRQMNLRPMNNGHEKRKG